MKQIKKRWLGLAITTALFALLGIASPAQANDYSSTCAGYPGNFDGTGNVNINNTGACTISVPVTAQGFVHITSSGAVNTQDVTAGTDLNITTSSGAITTLGLTTSNGNLKVNSATNFTVTGTIDSSISIQANANNGKIAVSGNVTSNLGGNGGNIFLVATGNVRTGSISTNGGTTTGGVEIHANTNANGALFNIGTATTNGVNGTINTSNSTAGGMITDFVVGGIFITNGNANSTAGIKVISAANINVTASASRSGIIYLDARKGTLTLPTGALSSTGPNGQPAGWIILMAGTLKTVNNTVITASQTAAALSTNHGVIVAASSITVAGAGGLKINGDGNGITGSFPTAYAQVIPTGGISITSGAFDSNNVDDMLWTPSLITSASTNGPVAVTGTGAFTLTSNGNYARASVYAYPITFSNAAVNITSKGTTNHQVELVFGGTMTGSNGLTMSGTGAVTLDASGSAGNDSGGTVYVLVDQATISATVPSLTIKADGKGTGTGGNVTFQPTKVVSLAAPTVNMSANNGKSTSGAGVVNFQPNGGNGTAAITSTTFNLTANGPTTGNGDAGVIYFSTSALTQGSTTKSIFSAKGAAAGMGKGGFITVFPGAIADYKLGTNPGNVQVIADGGLTGGDAGRININPFPGSLTIDTANAVSAKALGGNAKGGFVQLVGNPNLSVNPTANGATINVDAKGTSDAGEIHIFANGTLNLGSTTGSLLLSAKGDPAGTGDGGIIELGFITDLTISDISVDGGAGSSSDAKGGTINIHDSSNITTTGSLTANGGCNEGDGGDITLSGNIVTTSGTIEANSGSDTCLAIAARTPISKRSLGPQLFSAGNITINATNSWVASGSPELHADAKVGQSKGGIITIDTALPALMNDLSDSSITARGRGAGEGGWVSVLKAQGVVGPLVDTIDVNRIIKVNGGSNLGTGGLDGKVALNNVYCQQFRTGQPVYPKTYWNCMDNTFATGAGIVAAASSLPSPLLTQLSESSISVANPSLQLYAMANLNTQETFFGVPHTNILGVRGATVAEYRVSSIFLPTLPTQGELKMTTLHEIGHGLDYIWGYKSSLGVFNSFTAFNNLSCSVVYSPQLCSIMAQSGLNNEQELGVLDYQIDPSVASPRREKEVFARIFAHQFSLNNTTEFQILVDAEIAYGFLEDMNLLMLGWLTTPPAPVN